MGPNLDFYLQLDELIISVPENTTDIIITQQFKQHILLREVDGKRFVQTQPIIT